MLRPFRTSTTYRNLKARGEGVLHVTDDVLLLARTAIGPEVERRDPAGRRRPRAGSCVDACRYYEFRVVDLDDRDERTTIVAETVAEGRLRDFFGFNRAKHAVVEAAILATRTALLPLEEILAEYPAAGPARREDRRPRRARGVRAPEPVCRTRPPASAGSTPETFSP